MGKETDQIKDHISVCGADCSACACFGNMCNGCEECEGKVFHAPEGQACPIFACVRAKKGLPDCGKCGEVPCQIWMNTRDPKYSDEEFEKNVAERIDTLKKRSENEV